MSNEPMEIAVYRTVRESQIKKFLEHSFSDLQSTYEYALGEGTVDDILFFKEVLKRKKEQG